MSEDGCFSICSVPIKLTDFRVDLGVPRVISGGSRPAVKGRVIQFLR